MNDQPAGAPRINPSGETGAQSSTKETAQEIAHKAAEQTKRAARATGKSFLNIFKIWANLAPDPVSRTPRAVNEIGTSEAWQSLAWVAALYIVTLPFIEQNTMPLLMRHRHSLIGFVMHAAAICVGLTFSVFGSSKLFGGNSTLEKSAFAVSISLIPPWIVISATACFLDWTHTWIFSVIGFGLSIALFIMYAVFTRAFGLADRRATLAVPLALGFGLGVAFYLGKIAS
jgi:hypothetical protein